MDYEAKRQKIIYEIKAEKSKPHPDKKALRLLAKQIVWLDEYVDDFGGNTNDEPIKTRRTGWRNPSFGKWNSD